MIKKQINKGLKMPDLLVWICLYFSSTLLYSNIVVYGENIIEATVSEDLTNGKSAVNT